VGCAGQGPYSFNDSCWSCIANNCIFHNGYVEFGPFGTTGNLSTMVTVSGGGPYQLAYRLTNEGGGPPISWRAIIGSLDGSFSPIVLDTLTNSSSFYYEERTLPFELPKGTKAITLTFEARQVRILPFVLFRYNFRYRLGGTEEVAHSSYHKYN
jgi:hypothetical protein